MTFFEKLNLIERIDQLIKLKKTGSSEEFAARLGIARSSLFELLELMKSLGAEIEYCRHRKTYFYTSEKVLSIGFVNKDKLKGGENFSKYFLQSEFFGLSQHIFASETFQKGRF